MYVSLVRAWKELNASASDRNEEKVKKTKKAVVLS